MVKKGFDKRFCTKGFEGQWKGDSITGKMIVDLLSVKDSALIGTIGELFAWKYLRMRKGVLPKWFGGGPHFLRYPFRRGEVNYKINGLNNSQIEYLKKIPRRYDLIAVKRRRYESSPFVGEPEEIYLAEVKTTCGGAHLGGKMREKIPEDVQEAKSLGFRPLLIIVELLENWKFEVTCREL